MNGKVVIITGASSGIGKACAVEFSHREANVVVAARNEEKLFEVAEHLSGNGCLTVKTDVSIANDCKNLIDKTITKFGRIDILINNAGISMRALFEETDISVIKNIMDVNFWGTVYCTSYALPHILKSNGSVVGVSSVAGYIGMPGRTGYSASKFAMHGFLDALRSENRKKNLHVLVACPGFTATNIRNTALTATGSQQRESPRNESKMMQPVEVAKAIADAVVKRKNRITLSAEGRLTVFLNKFFPDFVSGKVYQHLAKEPGSPF